MEPPIEPPANDARPKVATTAIQFLFLSLAIGLLRAIWGLTQRTSGKPLILRRL